MYEKDGLSVCVCVSVSYDPEMKLGADKSPPTGVQEFSNLMKKACLESRDRRGGGGWGGVVEHGGA